MLVRSVYDIPLWLVDRFSAEPITYAGIALFLLGVCAGIIFERSSAAGARNGN